MLKNFLILFLFLTTSFMFYVNYHGKIPPPRIVTYVPFAGINDRGTYVSGFTYLPSNINLKEPVHVSDLLKAHSYIEKEERVKSARLLCKLEVLLQ